MPGSQAEEHIPFYKLALITFIITFRLTEGFFSLLTGFSYFFRLLMNTGVRRKVVHVASVVLF